MKKRSVFVMAVVFTLGTVVGAWAGKKKGIDSSLYMGKGKKEAAVALLQIAEKQAGKGSWERIAVARAYYLGGMKKEGQAIFDQVTARNAEGGDWIRIGRIYYQAGEWDKAKAAFEKALKLEPKDAPWLAEIGAYYNLKGDRKTAEEMFARSLSIETEEMWNTTDIAASYLGVTPLR